MSQLDPNSLSTFAQQLSETANTDESAIRKQLGLAFFYYHMDCEASWAGLNVNVALKDIAPDCTCASCGGNIHEAPRLGE